MNSTLHSASDSARLTAAWTLQRILPEVAALSLAATRAHWNLRGRAFLPLASGRAG